MTVQHVNGSLGVSTSECVELGSVTHSLYELEGSVREMMVYRPQGWLHDPPQAAVYIDRVGNVGVSPGTAPL